MGVHTFALVLTAAGSSARFNRGTKKEYEALQSSLSAQRNGGTVLSCAAEAFFCAADTSDKSENFIFSRFIVTVPAKDGHIEKARNALEASAFIVRMLAEFSLTPEFITGGSDRQESVYRALEHLASRGVPPDIVLIHDAARPFVSAALVHRVLNLCAQKKACAPYIPPVDTFKETEPETLRISAHLRRSRLAAVQTPQGFYFKPLLEAHRKARAAGTSCTDDTEIWGLYAGDVFLCEGEQKNIKITYFEDLPQKPAAAVFPVFRTGLGCDLHRLTQNRRLMIGGVHIPYEKGELAHSDGDVLLHAITDALLGAAAIGDIGELFPPSDNTWKDADSVFLLQTAWERVQNAGWKLENLDCVVSLERPKLLAWREKIRGSIAAILRCETERVFIKAKTAEGLGAVGAGEAVSAQCICLLKGGTF